MLSQATFMGLSCLMLALKKYIFLLQPIASSLVSLVNSSLAGILFLQIG